MKRIGMFAFALIACVAVPMTIIRSDGTAGATGANGHNARDQTPAVIRLPPVDSKPVNKPDRPPTILRPSDARGPFRLPTYVVPEKEEHGDLTAKRPPSVPGF